MRMMNAVIAVGFTALFAACSTADVPTGPSVASGPRLGIEAESPNGAWIELGGNNCNMIGSNAVGAPIGGGAGTVTVVVQNNNKLMLSCTGEGITNLSGSTQVYRDFPCGVRGVKDGIVRSGFDSKATVTGKGHATLSCTVEL